MAFPRIYALANNKEGVVKDYGSWFGPKWLWKVALRRPLFYWELEQWRGFVTFLDCITIRTLISDTIRWSFNSNGLFSVGLARGSLGLAGMGDVLRDSRGKVLCLFSIFLGPQDSNTAEIIAIWKACEIISLDPNFVGRSITIVSDSKVWPFRGLTMLFLEALLMCI
ncbi:hypothetical protein Dsin_005713 [Dipteronia sinensis]|uniref:RNase H type-1 domain-containing protein n=1 Tax=Dipteronia sinensis TaxID=43782 RepID=A0AAE0AX12_9ROSI|nr:hypothetical protein Dsin_005713 [Dipteronia sinensis]